MIVTALVAMVAAGTVPAASLDVTSVDASAYPTVEIDFVVPEPYAAVDLSAAMVDVDGAPAEALAPVDAGSVVVRLVVDDRPAVPADVVGASQGGAVEFVRNTAVGTRIAVGTPSGLQTAVTTDPGATIARIAAITAGAPAVSPLRRLILDSAAALAADESTDRHLVVALGRPLKGSDVQLAEIADVIADNGITLHLLRAAGAEEPALTLVAEQSGGTVADSSETLAFFDAVTAAISNRYRITTTLTSPGDHVVGLTIDGVRITADIDVEQPAVASEAPVAESASPTTLGAPAVANAVPTTAVAGPDADTAASDTDTAVADTDTAVADRGGGSTMGQIAVALEILMAVVVVVWLVLRWRRRWRDRGAPVVSSQPKLDRGADPSASEPRSARESSEISVFQPQPARKSSTGRTEQPLSAFELVVPRGSVSGSDVGNEARSQAQPAIADKGAPHDVGADVTEARAGVPRDGPAPKRPPQRKLALATKDDSASEAVAAGEVEGGPVTSKPKPKPRPKRAPKPKPAAEDAAAAEPGAAEEPVPKPKPKRTPKPKVPKGAPSASSVESDVAKAAVPTPKPKRKRTPKPRSEAIGEQANEQPPVPVSVSEPLSEAAATREPIVDQTPVTREPVADQTPVTREPIVDQTPVHEVELEPITEPTRDRRPKRQAAAPAAPGPADATQRRPARGLPAARSVRRRGERPTPAPRATRVGRRAPKPAVAAEGSSAASEWLVAGSLRFCPASGEVWAGSNQVHLTPSELAILELLMTGGNRGVSEADIIGAGGLEADGRDISDTLARIRRKTGLTGRGQTVRRERVMLYFLDDELETAGDTRVSHRPGRPSGRR